MISANLWALAQGALWVLVIVNTIVLVGLVRQVGIVLLRVGQVMAPRSREGPQQGDILRIPEVSMVVDWVSGVPDSPPRRRVLVFVSTDCGLCKEIVPAANVISRVYADSFDVVLVAQGTRQAVAEWSAQAKSKIPIAVVEDDLSQTYGIPGTPFATIVNHADAVLASGWVNHMEHLEALIRTCPRQVAPAADEDASVDDHVDAQSGRFPVVERGR